MTNNPPKNEMAQVVVEFPNSEERARRLRNEVERLARMSPVEWMYYVESGGYAEKYGIEKIKLKAMVEAVIKESEKRAREETGEQERREQRAERQRSTAKRENERKEREEERKQEREKRVAEHKERDKQKTFETVIKLPNTQHEGKLKALAKRIGEDIDVLRTEFEEFASEGKSETGGDIVPWPDPVNTKALLTDVMTQLRRYTVVSDEQALAITLWIMFAWLRENIVVHSPLLVFKSAEPDSGKTTACGVLKFLTPRAYSATEMTGPSLYRFVDRVHPTLIIDDADKLLQRKPELAHIINVGWTRGTLIPRVGPYGDPVWFNPFCAKVIAGAQLLLPKTTATRTITIKLLPKLPSERVEDFNHTDDERFYELRRKLARWCIDNAEALKNANPALPPGFNNRLAMNWRPQLAVADLAGGDWPKKARAAAVKLDDKREEQSEGIRVLTALASIFTTREEITSEEVVKHLNADLTGEWCEFRNRGPITQRQLAALLRAYEIYPVVLHPTKRSDLSRHGYRRSQFTDVFAHYLPNDPNIRTLKRKK
jgi:putative DNA primase/helicase